MGVTPRRHRARGTAPRTQEVRILRNSRKTAAAVAGLLSIGLVAAACGSDNKESSSSTTTGGATTTAASGGATTTAAGGGDDHHAASSKPAGGTITYGHDQEYTSYNNLTSDDEPVRQHRSCRTQVLPNTFIADDKGEFVMDKNLLDAARRHQHEPAGHHVQDQPEGGLERRRAHRLQGLLPGVDLTERQGRCVVDREGRRRQARPAVPARGDHRLRPDHKVECSADGKTITTTFDTPLRRLEGIFAGLLPAHIVEQKTGVADVTKATAEPT